MHSDDSLPNDIEILKQLVRIRDAELSQARAEASNARAEASSAEALIAHLRLTIEKLKRDLFGPRNERKARLLDQMELALEELEAAATEDEVAAEQAAAATTQVRAFTRRKPARQPFPAHLPRERIIVPGPTACACCGSNRLAKLGEDITETLEVIPRQWKVVQHVREKFTCRDCEKISQPPAPFHVLPRGFAGPSLLAMILFEKYGQHQPLNRQSERYARERIDLSVSTLADQVGGCAMLLRPLYELVRAHVFAGERVHGDETPVPVLAKHQCRKGRLWTYVRDDKPFAGPAPPAAVFFYSRDRTAENPERHLAGYAGILQADAYAGFNRLYDADRKGGPITEASCWAHGRRKFFELADVAAKARGQLSVLAPLAVEAVKRIDAIFDIEREINGRSADDRLAVRRERVAPLVADLEAWMRAQRGRLSRHSEVGKAMDYMLKRWETFSRFLADGRICLTNNAAERALRGIALGRKSWLFAGSDRGGERAAVMYTLIQTARLNGLDPQAWLADVLGRISDHNIRKLDELLPWNWKMTAVKLAA
ncbi:IS66 family transposase [Bradyrhizobium sp.]|uniref:IS66 family transposase n=1 Tax=Bradyrhizobium sp. TaxID=376 RepID=UPI0025BBE067|nr:IS66 family transposase [Bradyrhizobium sp.]MBV8920613.1 IS66 family transposase [Bradyrhizobium sp.]